MKTLSLTISDEAAEMLRKIQKRLGINNQDSAVDYAIHHLHKSTFGKEAKQNGIT